MSDRKLNAPLDLVLAPLSPSKSGREMHDLARELWPICRSLTGQGVLDTLAILRRHLPGLNTHQIASGSQVLDWRVPNEWNIRDAFIVAPDGSRICEFKVNNLHVMGYSVPVDLELDLEELRPHLHSLPEQPTAIPYLTSYYRERWGFCLTHEQLVRLRPGKYRAVIDATLAPGQLTYADLLVPGESEQEVLLSTYICHPSMANNELSGPVVATEIAKWIATLPRRRFTYRFVFVPETIGSIVYISRHIDTLKRNMVAGFMVNCVGDERAFGFMPSRRGGTLADRAALHALRHVASEFEQHSFLMRGSDERQYCSPGVDLPVASIFRSKYDTFPEYHTSLDDLDLITPNGLLGALHAFQRAIQAVEADRKYRATVLGEPNLGSRGLYPTVSNKDTFGIVFNLINVFAYSDGDHDLLDIADLLGAPIWELAQAAEDLREHGLLAEADMTGERVP